jgi:hypothetical protein
MSWAEVKKVNSDFVNEPLNFNNYINDISVFGADSYVMDKSNEDLWRQLITSSLTMFGHDAIHEYVLTRFTDDDVDYMIRKNNRLGQSFNSFYNIDSFIDGGIDKVLSQMTYAEYNKLDSIFQRGINRYIDKMTSENAGKWLDNIFGVSDFSSYASIPDILKNTNLWTTVISQNESMRAIICYAASAVTFVATEDTEIYKDFIKTVATSTQAMMELFEAVQAADKLSEFFDDEDIANTVASNRASMEAIMYSIPGFSAMISSETAMTIVSGNETAIEVLVEAIANSAKSEAVLSDINNDLSDISTNLEQIANTDIVIEEVGDVKKEIEVVVGKLQTVTSQTDVLINNINKILSDEDAMIAIGSSKMAMNAIGNDAKATSTVINNTEAMTALMSNAKCLATIISSDMTMGAEFSIAMGKYVSLIDTILSSSNDLFTKQYNSSAGSYTSNGSTNINRVETNTINIIIPTSFKAYSYYGFNAPVVIYHDTTTKSVLSKSVSIGGGSAASSNTVTGSISNVVSFNGFGYLLSVSQIPSSSPSLTIYYTIYTLKK